MDHCLSYVKPNISFPVIPSVTPRRPITFGQRVNRSKTLIVVASTNSKCGYGDLNTPLEPKSRAGRFLNGVVLDDRDNFQVVARGELERLATQKDEAVARCQLSLGSGEASLHRKIAELKTKECQVAVEEVMYMLIFHKFFEIRVHLVPRLSKCLYNSRLEIWPSKDWELESIHASETLELVREHINAVIGCRANSNVTDSWTKTSVNRVHICKLYTASILYGYFLKSASLRHNLEWGPLDRTRIPVSDVLSLGSEYIAFGRISSQRSPYKNQLLASARSSYSLSRKQEKESLKYYVMGFDQDAIQMCAKPSSKEAVNLIERHSCALFADEKTDLLENDDLIVTSFASLKRFMLEAVAFGSFLWDAEKQVNDVYMLEEN